MNSNPIIFTSVDEASFSLTKIFRLFFIFIGTDRSNLILFTIIIYAFNNEIISNKYYEKYKIKELEIRNNLKLGSPVQNEFHIDDIVSIFFDKKDDNTFYNIEAIIYDQNQFIASDSVEIELSKSNFNLVFSYGERIILNDKQRLFK